MLIWQSEFFSMGYSIEQIERLIFWDYLELIKGMSASSEKSRSSGSKGHFASSGKQLTDTQRKMIENRKKLNG